MSIKDKYCIIIPLYQNADKIVPLIQKIRAYLPDIFIFIIDDGSTDNPGQKVKSLKNIFLMRHKNNRGKGVALKTGMQKALDKDFQIAICMDSDFQHPPSMLPKFIHLNCRYNADLVLGCRQFKISIMPLHRILSNLITSFLISVRTGQRVHDSQCGYRLINLQTINLSDYNAQGFQFESEFIIKNLLQKKTYTELLIPTIYNKSVSSINNLMDTFRFIRLFLRSFLWT